MWGWSVKRSHARVPRARPELDCPAATTTTVSHHRTRRTTRSRLWLLDGQLTDSVSERRNVTIKPLVEETR